MEEQSSLSPKQSQEEQPSSHPFNHVFDSLKALPIDNLIGGPLEAAVKAQEELANNTEEFLKKLLKEKENQ